MHRLIAFLALVAGCAAEPPPSELRAPIIDGTIDSGDPAVVALTTAGGSPFCTGTLVSSRVVLTAGHCVEGIAPSAVYFGTEPGLGGSSKPVAMAYPHPDYDPEQLTADVGVVILATRQTQIEPVPFSTTPLDATYVGRPLRFVGFGYTAVGPSGDYGRKYQRENVPLTVVTESEVGYDVATCNGDSGGPAFLDFDGVERVIATTSWGDAACEQFGFSARVDIHSGWIQAQIDEHDPISCDKDWRCASGCGAVDPDCPCATDDGFCSALCLDTDSDPDCPQGCGENGACVAGCPNPDPDCGDPCGPEGHCLTDCPTRDPDCAEAVGPGEACETDFDCLDGLACLAGGPGKVCVETCVPGSDTCGEGRVCSRVSATTAICLDDPDADTGGCVAAPGRQERVSVLAGLLLAALLSFVHRRRMP